MRTRILLCSGLAATATVLVTAASAMALASVSPTGKFTATSSNVKLVFPAHLAAGPGTNEIPEGKIECKSVTINGVVQPAEPTGGNTVTGLEPPVFKECTVNNWLLSGTAKITAGPISQIFVHMLGSPPQGVNLVLGSLQIHVRTEQAFLFCDFDAIGHPGATVLQGSAPLVLTSLPFQGPLSPAKSVSGGECEYLYTQTPISFSGTFALNHLLTVS